MKFILPILLIIAFNCCVAAESLISRFDVEPQFEATGLSDTDNDLEIDRLKHTIGKKFTYPFEEIFYSQKTAEWVKLEEKKYYRYVFQILLKDQKGAHGHPRKIIIIWLDDMKNTYKIFDAGTVYPV